MLYISAPTQKLNLSAGLPGVLKITNPATGQNPSPTTKTVALTQTATGPKALKQNNTWILFNSKPVFVNNALVKFSGPQEIESSITTSETSTSIAGPQDPIQEVQYNAEQFDFSLNSLSAAQGSNPTALSLLGFTNPTEAFNPNQTVPSVLYRPIAKLDFVLQGNKEIEAFSGMGDIETLQFAPHPGTPVDPSITLTDGLFDFDENDIRKVDILTVDGQKLSTETGELVRNGNKLECQFGYFNQPSTARLVVFIVIYLIGHDKGIVICGPNTRDYLMVDFFKVM